MSDQQSRKEYQGGDDEQPLLATDPSAGDYTAYQGGVPGEVTKIRFYFHDNDAVRPEPTNDGYDGLDRLERELRDQETQARIMAGLGPWSAGPGVPSPDPRDQIIENQDRTIAQLHRASRESYYDGQVLGHLAHVRGLLEATPSITGTMAAIFRELLAALELMLHRDI